MGEIIKFKDIGIEPSSDEPIFKMYLIDNYGNFSHPVDVKFKLLPNMDITNAEDAIWTGLNGVAHYYLIIPKNGVPTAGEIEIPEELTEGDEARIRAGSFKIIHHANLDAIKNLKLSYLSNLLEYQT